MAVRKDEFYQPPRMDRYKGDITRDALDRMMPKGRNDNEESAVGYIEAANTMLEAAADEAPTLIPAVNQIKTFVAQVLQQAMVQANPMMGISGPPTSSPGLGLGLGPEEGGGGGLF
jgi:hypothetical protein